MLDSNLVDGAWKLSCLTIVVSMNLYSRFFRVFWRYLALVRLRAHVVFRACKFEVHNFRNLNVIIFQWILSDTSDPLAKGRLKLSCLEFVFLHIYRILIQES